MSEFCQKYWCSSNGDFSLACCQCVRGKSSIKVIESSWILFFLEFEEKSSAAYVHCIRFVNFFSPRPTAQDTVTDTLWPHASSKRGKSPGTMSAFPLPFLAAALWDRSINSHDLTAPSHQCLPTVYSGWTAFYAVADAFHKRVCACCLLWGAGFFPPVSFRSRLRGAKPSLCTGMLLENVVVQQLAWIWVWMSTPCRVHHTLHRLHLCHPPPSFTPLSSRILCDVAHFYGSHRCS